MFLWIVEPNNGEITQTQIIKLAARSVYSKYSIMPVRDLNFGSLIHGVKGTRHVVIENLGEFDFKYSIYKIIQGVTDSKTLKNKNKGVRPTSPGGSVRPPIRAVKNADAANFGSFTVSPTSGVCQAGQRQQITVELHPENPGSYEESVAIDISDRSPLEQDVLEYRLIGESRVPGINTVDFTSIFEEQTVCKRMELFNTQANAYAEEDRVFYFGAYLTGQVAYVRFKISNPFKVACDIQISTRPRSRTKSEATDFAFDVEPKKLNIQSHESKYVTVSFLPSTIQSYAGIFEAIVDNVADNKNKTLSFEIRGEGTLPRVSVEKPIVRTKTGIQVLKFAKALLGKTQKLPIVIKNEGIITAKIKLEWIYKDSDEFECGGLNIVHVLKPLELKTFEVTYKPVNIGKFDADLKMKVMDNSFEDTSISIQGEGYLDELTFDNIPNNITGENEITFLECHVRKQKTLKFGMTNHSANQVRVAWTETADFTMSPEVMHIRPRSTKEVAISFFSKQPCEIVKAALSCKVSKIKYTRTGTESDWDDRQKSAAWVATEGPNKNQRKEQEATLEPPHEVNSTSDQVLFASAFADYCAYECSTTQIDFKPTLMYQSRVFKITVKNTGKVSVKYSFLLFDEEGSAVSPDSKDCPFSADPDQGVIDANDSLNATIRFSPNDEGTYSDYHLVFMAPNLAKEMVPLNISLSGRSVRPFCHFELEDSDYIASERTTPELNLQNGAPMVLEAGTKVIEFNSCGIKGM